MSLLLVLPLTAALTWLGLFLYSIRAKVQSHIPGPRPLPWLGNSIEFQLNEKRLNKWLIECSQKYGQTWTASMICAEPYIMTTSRENLKYILADNFANYPKGLGFSSKLHDLLGRGIFNADGETWKTQRKTASHIFTARALREDMLPTFVEHGKTMMQRLAEVADQPNQHIDMQDLFFKYTLDSICKIAFGVDLHCLESKEPVEFAVAFDTCQRLIDKRFVTIGWQVSRWLGIGDEARMKRALVKVDKFAHHVVAERKKLSQEQLESRTDLLSKFMQSGKDAAGNAYSDEDYRNVIINFIIAGRDTTAQNLGWMMYELALHPDEADKCFAEIRRVVGEGKQPDYKQCMEELPYTRACVNEALRLHPSVPKEMKHAINDDTLPDGTFVPRGAAVLPLLQAMLRTKEVWGDDANEFKPQRWIDRENEPDAFTFPAFQAGPRTCLGKHMAQLEATYVAATILNKYALHMVPGQTIEEDIALTLPARYGILMTVESRDQQHVSG